MCAYLYFILSCIMEGYNLYEMKLCEQVGLCRQQLVCLYKQPSRIVNLWYYFVINSSYLMKI